ncbi:MAG: TVP38/TMEM64 family protein, partial [archaeon]
MPVRSRKKTAKTSSPSSKPDGLMENIPSILFLLAIGVIALIPIFIPDISRPIAEFVQTTVHSFGIWGPIVLVLVMILSTIFSPIPNTLITLTMGATYGPVYGTILAMIGSILASALAFFLARRFGEKIVEKYFPTTHFIHRFLNNNAFLSVFLLRVIPSISFDLVSYGVGLTKIPFRTFIVATFLGIIPGTVSIVLVGAGLTYDSNLS